MSIALSAKLKVSMCEGSDGGLVLRHWCPACLRSHMVNVTKPNQAGSRWEWNKDIEKVSFTPSVNLGDDTERCHYVLTDGVLYFMGDCTHNMAGTTVPLPNFPAEHRF